MESKFFVTRKMADNVTAICGYCSEVAYLVEGTERALLIDGLTGVGSLKSFVRDLTELPVQIVITHGHLDHIGAIFEYGEGYIHPYDIPLMYTDHHASIEGRWRFAQQEPYSGIPRLTPPNIADVVPPCPVKTWPVYDGDIFDLGGGVQLEVIHVPGHTVGSIVLLDRKNRLLFSGDACNINTLLALDGSATVEEYRDALLHLQTFVPEFDGMLGGHGAHPASPMMVEKGIELCDRILAGTDDGVMRESVGRVMRYASGLSYPELFQNKMPNIAYDPERLHRRPTPVITDGPNLYR